MSHDKQNPFSNETGEYLQEVTEKENISEVEAPHKEAEKAPETKPQPAKRPYVKRSSK